MILAERRGLAALPARAMLGFAQRLRRGWWHLRQPHTMGSRAICLTPEHRVILVRHSYRAGWFLPGGAPKIGEDPCRSLMRELREEIGLIEHDVVTPLFVVEQRASGKHDRQSLFLVKDARLRPRLSFEIEAIAAFPLDRLPPLPASTRYKLARWRGEVRGDVPVPDEG